MSEVHDLSALLQAVTAARSAVEDARQRPSRAGAPSTVVKQEELLCALEEYEAELSRRGQPLPYRLRNEVTMYRLMFAVHRRSGR